MYTDTNGLRCVSTFNIETVLRCTHYAVVRSRWAYDSLTSPLGTPLTTTNHRLTNSPSKNAHIIAVNLRLVDCRNSSRWWHLRPPFASASPKVSADTVGRPACALLRWRMTGEGERGRDGERATGCRETSAFNLTAVRRRLMEGRCRRTYVDYNASSNFLENYYALILGTIFLATRIAVKPAVRWLLSTTRSETYSYDISGQCLQRNAFHLLRCHGTPTLCQLAGPHH